MPHLDQTSVDERMLGFIAVIAVAVGLLFGLAPAVLGSSVQVTHALGVGGTRVTGAAGRRVRHTLVAAQLALAVMLLVGAGLLVRSFIRVAGLDLGFRAPHVLTAMINLSPARYGDAAPAESRSPTRCSAGCTHSQASSPRASATRSP